MNRKERRTLQKQMGKEATSTIDLMLSLSDECLTCKKPYDKMNKEMVKTWSVEIFYSQKKVDLYCPECFTEKQQNGKKN
jgi:hypothetical protein